VLFDVQDGRVERTVRTPEDYGLARCAPGDLAGGDAAHNARELTRVFTGEDRGPHRDALVMSTSLVLEVQGLANDPMHGVELANAALDAGNAAALLRRLRAHFES
jgi:anthranilate phosphoribosyltransferase